MTSQPEEVEHRESDRITVVCPECGAYVVVKDVHAFIQGLHERVCPELSILNGVLE